MTASCKKLVPSRVLRDRFGGVSVSTLGRWVKRGVLPRPVTINGRHYWPESVLELLNSDKLGLIKCDENPELVEGLHK